MESNPPHLADQHIEPIGSLTWILVPTEQQAKTACSGLSLTLAITGSCHSNLLLVLSLFGFLGIEYP
jgi:hypothetical protein